MKGDFSRLTFDARQHYAAPLQQQGRVATDADWNEWVEALLYRLKVETIDVIGKCGRPIHAPGFGISINGQGSSNPSVQLSAGRLYAGGLMAETGQTDFAQQFDWPLPSQVTWNTLFPNGPVWPGIDFSALANGASTLFYAEVWLRHLTSLNDEAERDQAFSDAGGNPDWDSRPEVGDFIRERALGGPDTCTRLQTVAQVKVWDASSQQGVTDCPSACAALAQAQPPGPPGTTGTLQVNVTPTPPVQKPCQEPLTGGYGGAENRAYRVEVHDPGPAGTATFKWSNENGAFTVRVNAQALTTINANTDIILQSIGNDQTTQLRQNDFVEMCGEETELGLFRNSLAQLVNDPVAQPDGTWKVQLTRAVVVPGAPFLRRWSADVQTVVLNTPFNLDAGSGLSVSFFDGSGGTQGNTYFHEMDYWMWAARTLTRGIEPADISHTPQPTRGIERHRCCLALVTWTVTSGIEAGEHTISGAIDECPDLFPPLTELPTGGPECCFCTITVGDGQTSHGQYNDLPTAFAHIPQNGAIVCILPGSYTLEQPLAIPQNKVVIRGAGLATQLFGANGIFTADQRDRIVITDLSMGAIDGPVIAISASQHVRIQGNQILLQENAGIVGVSVQGEDISIEHNAIRGDAAGGGGIEVRGNSRFMHIRENYIGDGSLRGITLGSFVVPQSSGVVDVAANPKARKRKTMAENVNAAAAAPPQSEGPLDTVDITGNTIVKMGRDGIGSALPPAGTPLLEGFAALSPVNNLRIVGNTIQRCWEPPDGSTPDISSVFAGITGAVSLADVEHLEIEDNQIEDNGSQAALSGIYVLLGAGMRIDGNRILRNGAPAEARSKTRGGIVIVLALPPADPRRQRVTDGWRAVSAHDNIVETDSAHALLLAGAGPISVLGNRLERQGLVASDTTPGSTVCILNFGIGEDYAGFLGTHAQFKAKVMSETQANPLLQYLKVLGGETLFAHNQCLLTVGEESVVAPCSALIASLDDLGFSANQMRCQATASRAQPFLVMDCLLYALSNRVEDSRFTETLNGTLVSCYGGGVLTSGIGNQGTHCLLFNGTQDEAIALNLVSPLFKAFCKRLSGLLLGQAVEVGG